MVVRTIADKGSAIIPVSTSGIVLDLIERLDQALNAAGLHSIPLYLLSPSSEHSIGYANISGEWYVTGHSVGWSVGWLSLTGKGNAVHRMSDTKRNKIYIPEDPFNHPMLIKVQPIVCGALAYDCVC